MTHRVCGSLSLSYHTCEVTHTDTHISLLCSVAVCRYLPFSASLYSSLLSSAALCTYLRLSAVLCVSLPSSAALCCSLKLSIALCCSLLLAAVCCSPLRSLYYSLLIFSALYCSPLPLVLLSADLRVLLLSAARFPLRALRCALLFSSAENALRGVPCCSLLIPTAV